MATFFANPFLVIALFFCFTQNVESSESRTLARAYNAKRYSLVMSKYFKSSRKKRKYLIKNSRNLFYLSNSAFKMKKYSYAYRFYKIRLLKNHRRLLTKLRKIAESGDEVNFKIPRRFKKLYMKTYYSLVQLIQQKEKYSRSVVKNMKKLTYMTEVVEVIEYENVDALFTKAQNHATRLKKKRRRFKKTAFINLTSWQLSADITKNDNSFTGDLIITNTGFCSGADFRYENDYQTWLLEACFLYGSGNISQNVDSIEYAQQNVVTYGAKISPGMSFFVSKNRAEFGFKLPILFVLQDLESPANYTVESPSLVHIIASIYTKWPIGKYFIQTDFGRFISQHLSIWSVGIGRSF